MFNYFISLLSKKTTYCYPEALIKAEIEYTVDSTDPWIRAVSGYKKKLRPAVLRAMNYAEALVEEMPSFTFIKPRTYFSNPRLRPFFISSSDMWKVLDDCVTSSGFQRGQEGTLPWVYALLTMQKIEKSFLGAEVSGVIVLRDVVQHAVSFESHHLLDPAESEDEIRRKLKIRTFDHLLRLAHRRITSFKSEREKLEKHRELLQSTLSLMQRTGQGCEPVSVDWKVAIAEIKALIGNVEVKLLELGGNYGMLDTHLDILTDVLGRPEEHLWIKKESLIIDRMGIRRNEPADGTQKVALDIICDSDDLNLVALPVAISGEAIQTLIGDRVIENLH